MSNLAQRIEDVLTVLYDYEYIDIEKFYNDKENMRLLNVLNETLTKDAKDLFPEEEQCLIDLYNSVDDHIKFETNYNSNIGDF